MRNYRVILLVALFGMSGCSLFKASEESPQFSMDVSDTSIIVKKTGEINVTYDYPACLVQSQDKNHIVVTHKTESGSSGSTLLSAFGGVVLLLLNGILRLI